MIGVDRDTGLVSRNAVALAIQESGSLRTNGSLGLSWEAIEAVSVSRDVHADIGDSARAVPDMADGEREPRQHIHILEAENSRTSTASPGRDSSYMEFSVPCFEKQSPGDESNARSDMAAETGSHSHRDTVHAVYLPLETRQVTWRTGNGSGLSTRSLDQVCQSNVYAEVNLADLMVSHGIQDQLSREVAGGSLEVGLLGSRFTDLMPGSPTQDQSGGSQVRTRESVYTVVVHSQCTSVSQSDCGRRVNEAEETQQPVQEGKGSTELRMGVSSFPVLETLDPSCSTDSGFAPKPIPVGFSPYSSVVDPRPIELRSNPKPLPETWSVQAECGVCDAARDSLHCLQSTCNGAGWSGQQVSGDESASAEHGRTIPIPGPEQPVCLIAEDSGVQVWQCGVSEGVSGLSPEEVVTGSCDKRGSAKWLSFSGHVDLAQASSQSSGLSLMRDVVGCSPCVQSGFCPSESRPCELRVAGSVQAAMPVATVQTEAPGVLGKVQSFSGTLDEDVHRMLPMAGHGGSNHVQGKGLITKSAAVTLSPHYAEDSVESPQDRFHPLNGTKQEDVATWQGTDISLSQGSESEHLSNAGSRKAVAVVRSQNVRMIQESQAAWPDIKEQRDAPHRITHVGRMPQTLLDASRCTRSLPKWVCEDRVNQHEALGPEPVSLPQHERPGGILSGLDPNPRPAHDAVYPSRTPLGIGSTPRLVPVLQSDQLSATHMDVGGMSGEQLPADPATGPEQGAQLTQVLEERAPFSSRKIVPEACAEVSANPNHKPIGFSPEQPRVQGLPGRDANLDPNHKLLGFSPDFPQVQGSLRGNADADPNHKLLGLSPDFPQVQGSPHGNADADPSHRLIGFSPVFPQVKGSPRGNADSDPSHRLIGFSPDLPQVQGFWNGDSNVSPSQGPLRLSSFSCCEGGDGQWPGATGAPSVLSVSRPASSRYCECCMACHVWAYQPDRLLSAI